METEVKDTSAFPITWPDLLVHPGDFMSKFHTAWQAWDVKYVAKVAYGEDYDRCDQYNQGYLNEKFENFKKNPLKFYCYLDLPNQRRFVKAIWAIILSRKELAK